MRRTFICSALFVFLVSAGIPALAQEEGYLYYDPHPVPSSALGEVDVNWIDIEGLHTFPFAPDPEEMDFYIIEDGAFIFIGDPSMYDSYEGEEYWYYGPHPVDYYGYDHICYISGPHVHWFVPTVYWLNWYYWDTHVYVWYGPWPAHYHEHRVIHLHHHYPAVYKHKHRHVHLHKHYKKNPPPRKQPPEHQALPPGVHAKKPRFPRLTHKGPHEGFNGKRARSTRSKARRHSAHERSKFKKKAPHSKRAKRPSARSHSSSHKRKKFHSGKRKPARSYKKRPTKSRRRVSKSKSRSKKKKKSRSSARKPRPGKSRKRTFKRSRPTPRPRARPSSRPSPSRKNRRQ